MTKIKLNHFTSAQGFYTSKNELYGIIDGDRKCKYDNKFEPGDMVQSISAGKLLVGIITSLE